MASQHECESGFRLRECGSRGRHGPHDWGAIVGGPWHCEGKALESMVCNSTEVHGPHLWGGETIVGPWNCPGVGSQEPAASVAVADIGGATVNPGDALILVSERGMSAAEMEATKRWLEGELPGVKVLVVVGYKQALVYNAMLEAEGESDGGQAGSDSG